MRHFYLGLTSDHPSPAVATFAHPSEPPGDWNAASLLRPCRESAVFGRVLGLIFRGGAACGWIVGSSDDRGQKHTRGGKKDQTGPAVCAVLAWVLCHNGLAISVGPHITIVASRAAAQRGFLGGCDTVTSRSCASRAQNGREPPCRHLLRTRNSHQRCCGAGYCRIKPVCRTRGMAEAISPTEQFRPIRVTRRRGRREFSNPTSIL